MLDALMTGQALTATELARAAAVGRATASEHLTKLREAGFVDVESHGRHRYYRLAGPDVAAALESLSHVAPAKPVATLRQSSRARSLAEARTCYDHLAGRSGVALHDALVARDWLIPKPGGYSLTDSGAVGLRRWGVEPPVARGTRRTYARPCLDWTERRDHLAGVLAATIATTLIDGPNPWFVRTAKDHRGLRLTALGRTRLAELGWEPVNRSA